MSLDDLRRRMPELRKRELLSHIMASVAWRALVGGGGGGQALQPEGAYDSARA
jgi:hypothetical protein